MIIKDTSFSQAVKEFQKFLSENNLPTDVLWVFIEDTFSINTKDYRTDCWLKLPLPEENEMLMEKYYQVGQKRDLGVGISALALCKDKVVCSLVIPQDKQDSEYLFMSTKYLKFSFPEDLPLAKPIKNNFRWNIFNTFSSKYKQGCYFVYLISKKDLQFLTV